MLSIWADLLCPERTLAGTHWRDSLWWSEVEFIGPVSRAHPTLNTYLVAAMLDPIRRDFLYSGWNYCVVTLFRAQQFQK